MSYKAEIIKEFCNAMAQMGATYGLPKLAKNVVSGDCGDGAIISFRAEFFGTEIIDVNIFAGVRLPDIEKRLDHMRFFNGRPKSPIKETVFQKLNNYILVDSGTIIPSSFRVPDKLLEALDCISESVDNVKNTFCTQEKLARYCLTDVNLPLGHHCFRIPFILATVGMMNECRSYTDSVIERGFIDKYDVFLDEFYQLPL